AHDVARVMRKRRCDASARALLSRSITVIVPSPSSQTRNRANTRAPRRFSETNLTDGAWLPCTVVVVVSVLLPTVLELLDGAVERPADVRAVTSARKRWPTSSARTPYAAPLAPATLTQSVPDVLQRCHWNPNDVGVGDQVPRETCSSSPTVAVPLIAGRTE